MRSATFFSVALPVSTANQAMTPRASAKPAIAARNIPSLPWIIVPVPVVVEPRLTVMVLAREAKINRDGPVLPVELVVGFVGTEGLALPAPDELSVGVAGEPRGIEMIGVEVDQVLPMSLRAVVEPPPEALLPPMKPPPAGVELGEGPVIAPHIGPPGAARGAGLGDEVPGKVIVIHHQAGTLMRERKL